MSSTKSPVGEQGERGRSNVKSLPTTVHISRSDPSSGNPSNQPLTIAPRSRKGCLTCRNRHMKCDEGKPSCQSCIRRGLDCDYRYRFKFQDDTPRLLKRMQVVNPENSPWNCEHFLSRVMLCSR